MCNEHFLAGLPRVIETDLQAGHWRCTFWINLSLKKRTKRFGVLVDTLLKPLLRLGGCRGSKGLVERELPVVPSLPKPGCAIRVANNNRNLTSWLELRPHLQQQLFGAIARR